MSTAATSNTEPDCLASARPTAEFLGLIPHEYARRHLILSAGIVGVAEKLLVADSTGPASTFNVGVRLQRPVLATTVEGEALAGAIDRTYASARPADDAQSIALEAEGSDPAAEMAALLRDAERDLLNTRGKGPVIRLVDLILFEALQRRASDVHVQPLADRVLIRYRLDGVLHTVREMPASLASALISRVKVMGRLDVAEQRAPQDGRATVTIGGQTLRRVDLRISTLPTTYGERVVVRLLDTSRAPHLQRLSALGMPPDVERPFLAQVSRSSGIVLVTGPTGSGKTTTLYTTLAWITTTSSHTAGCEFNIMTVEDPVEYDLATSGLAISQTQLNSRKGVTFAAGLRHILRQDPDVIMVGEVRDEETARIAVQASLTGHLVLSTLHTNDAASAVARLLDLGVEPFLVSSSLSAALAQRLVRVLHPPCGGRGCADCLSTGFRGRTGVFELFVLDEEIRREVSRRAPISTLAGLAIERGMVTLARAGERLVRAGTTTSEEVARVIEAAELPEARV